MTSILQISIFALALQDVVAFNLRATSNSTFTVNDKISINGVEVASGTGIDQVLGCNTAPKDATEVTVCGPNVRVTANLLTECQSYNQYSHACGSCDSGSSGCQTCALESGYTEKFNWVAASYKVEKC